MKGRVFIWLLLVIGAAYVFRDSLFSTNPALDNIIPQSNRPATITETIVVTRIEVISVTATPQPTYTPYPTYTPQPTAEPIIIIPTPIVINVAGDYGSGGKYDQIASLWLPRVVASILLVFVPVAGVYMFYLTKNAQIEADKEVRLRQIEQEEALNKPAARPIIVNAKPTDDNYIAVNNGNKVHKDKIIEFIMKFEEVGLSINRWRSMSGLNQPDIENILDHIESLGLVTERASGVASQWRREVSKFRLCHYFGLAPSDLSRADKTEITETDDDDELAE